MQPWRRYLRTILNDLQQNKKISTFCSTDKNGDVDFAVLDSNANYIIIVSQSVESKYLLMKINPRFESLKKTRKNLINPTNIQKREFRQYEYQIQEREIENLKEKNLRSIFNFNWNIPKASRLRTSPSPEKIISLIANSRPKTDN